MLFMTRKRRHLDLERQLDSIPLRNRHIRVREDPDRKEALLVEVDLAYSGWKKLASFVLKPRKTKEYRIVGIGRQVYESVDGRRSFVELIEDFQQQHHLTFFEARALLMQYMQTLMERGLIVMGIPETNG